MDIIICPGNSWSEEMANIDKRLADAGLKPSNELERAVAIMALVELDSAIRADQKMQVVESAPAAGRTSTVRIGRAPSFS
jgi:hypothetical protein